MNKLKAFKAFVLYQLAVFAAFFAVYTAIGFADHFVVPTARKRDVDALDVAYHCVLTHHGASLGDIYPVTSLGRTVLALHCTAKSFAPIVVMMA